MKTIPVLLSLTLAATASDSFDRARLVMETRCLSCHCEDKTKGDLLLTTGEHLLKGGDSGAAIDLDQPEKSALLHRVKLDEDDDDIMPPKGKPLNPSEIATLGSGARILRVTASQRSEVFAGDRLLEHLLRRGARAGTG